MAHMMKHTKASCGHMFAHYDREAGERIGNDSIDHDRSDLNYNLATDQQMQQGDFVRKRCSEVHCQNRKDVNVMVSWVVTAPKDLPEDEHKAFFQATYDFLAKRYGAENVVSAWVHMDETQPHMHFAFVPVVHDQKRGRDKVSAKEAVNRIDLRTFHGDLQECIEQKLGHEVGILNEATKDGNKSIKELKRQSASERMQEISEKASVVLSEAEKLKQAEKILNEQIEGLKRDVMSAQQVKDVPHSKALIGDKVLLAPGDFEELCRTASLAEDLLKEIKPARKINALASEIIQKAKEEATEIVQDARQQAFSVAETKKSVKLKHQLEHIEKVINSSPALLKAYQQAEKAMQERQRAHPAERGFDR